MTQFRIDVLLFGSMAMNAALLLFIAGVLGKTMNDMQEDSFQHFLSSFVNHSSRSPVMITMLNLPAIGGAFYLYQYGFGNRWMVAALICWIMGGAAGKIYKVPLYRRIAKLPSEDIQQLAAERMRLNAANMGHAACNCVALALALTAVT